MEVWSSESMKDGGMRQDRRRGSLRKLAVVPSLSRPVIVRVESKHVKGVSIDFSQTLTE